MALINISASDTAPASDNHTPSTLIIPAEYLMRGVNPFLAGCRHLVKEALAEVNKYPKAVLEIKHGNKTFRRVIKEKGFSCEPYFTNEKNEKILQKDVDEFLKENPWKN